MNVRQRLFILSWVVLSCVGVDQFTKWIATGELRGKGMTAYLGDFFRLQYSENPGAFLSLGAGLSNDSRFWFLTVLVGGVLVAAGAYLLMAQKISKLSVHALAWTVAGGMSNLIDRAFRDNGAVVDFMNVGIGSLRTGIFNVADMAIMAGVALLVLDLGKEAKEEKARV